MKVRWEKFEIGQKVKVRRVMRKLYRMTSPDLNPSSIHTVKSIKDVPDEALNSVGHTQWITTDCHLLEISGAFFQAVKEIK